MLISTSYLLPTELRQIPHRKCWYTHVWCRDCHTIFHLQTASSLAKVAKDVCTRPWCLRGTDRIAEWWGNAWTWFNFCYSFEAPSQCIEYSDVMIMVLYVLYCTVQFPLSAVSIMRAAPETAMDLLSSPQRKPILNKYNFENPTPYQLVNNFSLSIHDNHPMGYLLTRFLHSATWS